MKRFIAIVLVFLFMFSLSSCDKEKKLNKNFIGKWYLNEGTFHLADYWSSTINENYQEVSIEFFDDGTVQFIGDKENLIGEYSVLDDYRIKLNFEGEPIIEEYDFARDELELFYPYEDIKGYEYGYFGDSKIKKEVIETEEKTNQIDGIEVKSEINLPIDESLSYEYIYPHMHSNEDICKFEYIDGETELQPSMMLKNTPYSYRFYVDNILIESNNHDFGSFDYEILKLSNKFSNIKIEKVNDDGDIVNTAMIEGFTIYDLGRNINLNFNENNFTDIQSLMILDSRNGIELDLSPIAKLVNLKNLYLSYTSVSDIQALSKLKKLECLFLDLTLISDISAIADLENLRVLSLSSTYVTDITEISSLKKLRILDIGDITIEDYSSLNNLKDLEKLYMINQKFTSIPRLTGLQNLKILSLAFCFNLKSLLGIEELKKLESLDLSMCSELKDIYGIEKLDNLVEIYLQGDVNIVDLSPVRKP